MAWTSVEPPDGEGWTMYQAQFEHEDEACFVALGLGARAEVVEPAELRERVLNEVRAVLARTAR
jgi:predicted DNA-binding transcriptional regulator YafY